MKGLLVVLLLAQDGEIDQALARFREAYRNAKDDAGKASAVSNLALTRHDRVLKELIPIFKATQSVPVKEACIQAIARYSDSADAAAALADFLDTVRKSRERSRLTGVTEKCLEGLSMLERNVSRPHVEKVHAYLRDPDLGVVVKAIHAVGRIRDKSSIPELLELMRTAQEEMKLKLNELPDKDKAG